MVARRAHNPEVVGSSPASATKKKTTQKVVFFCFNTSIFTGICYKNSKFALLRFYISEDTDRTVFYGGFGLQYTERKIEHAGVWQACAENGGVCGIASRQGETQ